MIQARRIFPGLLPLIILVLSVLFFIIELQLEACNIINRDVGCFEEEKGHMIECKCVNLKLS